MFTAFFADPSNENCISSDYSFEDTVLNTMMQNVEIQDRFIYLINMYRIIVDCSDDFSRYKVEQKRYFWKVNKYLLNYVNAVYSFKEYIENCYGKESEVNKIADKYYRQTKWYTFLCNYRNRIIHQSAVIKDYDLNSGNVYIDLDELIEGTRQQIESSGKGKKNGEQFIAFVHSQFPSTLLIGEHHFIGAKQMLEKVNAEIKDMVNEVFLHLYETEVKQCFEWFLSMTLQNKEEKYLSTYIIQDGTRKNFQTNFYLEDYAVNIMFTIGKGFDITRKIIDFFKTAGYDYFYTQNCDLDALEEALDVPENLA